MNTNLKIGEKLPMELSKALREVGNQVLIVRACESLKIDIEIYEEAIDVLCGNKELTEGVKPLIKYLINKI